MSVAIGITATRHGLTDAARRMAGAPPVIMYEEAFVAPLAPGWVAPWDHSWVKVHKLTRPMFITLYDAAILGSGRVHSRYPGGSWRLIRAGLFRRYLIDEDLRLTACGLVLAVWARRAVERAYPTRPDEVRTR